MRRELSRNTVIYGYSSDDPADIRFSQIKQYADPAFAMAHPYVYFSTWEEDMAWEIFAVFYAHVDLPYNRTDLSDEEYKRTMQAVLETSIYDYGGQESVEDDKILTLSTMAYSIPNQEGDLTFTEDYSLYRFAIMARLLPPDASIDKTAEFTQRDIKQIAYRRR